MNFTKNGMIGILDSGNRNFGTKPVLLYPFKYYFVILRKKPIKYGSLD
jgi:hypothetical protein